MNCGALGAEVAPFLFANEFFRDLHQSRNEKIRQSVTYSR
jgi:hypothetical protein